MSHLPPHGGSAEDAPPPPLPEPLARVHGENPWGVSPSWAEAEPPPGQAPTGDPVAVPAAVPLPASGSASSKAPAAAVALLVVIALVVAGMAAFLVFDEGGQPVAVRADGAPAAEARAASAAGQTAAADHPAERGKFEPQDLPRDPEAGKFEPLPE